VNWALERTCRPGQDACWGLYWAGLDHTHAARFPGLRPRKGRDQNMTEKKRQGGSGWHHGSVPDHEKRSRRSGKDRELGRTNYRRTANSKRPLQSKSDGRSVAPAEVRALHVFVVPLPHTALKRKRKQFNTPKVRGNPRAWGTFSGYKMVMLHAMSAGRSAQRPK